MSSPVERLEAWCDHWATVSYKKVSPVLAEQIDAGIGVYRAIISEYRELRPSSLGRAYRKGIYRSIELLADAVNPEEK